MTTGTPITGRHDRIALASLSPGSEWYNSCVKLQNQSSEKCEIIGLVIGMAETLDVAAKEE